MGNQKRFLNRRGQMFAVGVIVWILLACWTISAFWGHIDELGESYQSAARLGALAAEVIGIGFLWWHCFDPSITVRRWALLFSVALASILVFHAGALRGLKDARIKQTEAENRLASTLTKMSKEQTAGLGESSGALVASGQTQRERIAIAGKTAAQQSEINRAAQETVAREIVAGNDRVKDTAIVPRWYLDGWMYAVIFMTAMAMLGFLWWKMSDADDLDEDYNGVPDRLERQPAPVVHQVIAPAAVPVAAQSEEKPRQVWRGGVQINPPEDLRGN